MTTRGLTLFNPMNLMTNPDFTWQGEIKPTSDSEGRLCQFDTFIDGIRAGTKNLLAYKNHGCDTVRKIINRYAPASENPTSNYIQYVSGRCGVDPDAVVDLSDQDFMQKFVDSIIRFEQGVAFCTAYQITTGVNEALAA